MAYSTINLVLPRKFNILKVQDGLEQDFGGYTHSYYYDMYYLHISYKISSETLITEIESALEPYFTYKQGLFVHEELADNWEHIIWKT